MKRKVDWGEEDESEQEDYSDGKSVEEKPPFPEGVLLNCCRVWLLPKIYYFGHSWVITPTSAHNSSDKYVLLLHNNQQHSTPS